MMKPFLGQQSGKGLQAEVREERQQGRVHRLYQANSWWINFEIYSQRVIPLISIAFIFNSLCPQAAKAHNNKAHHHTGDTHEELLQQLQQIQPLTQKQVQPLLQGQAAQRSQAP